MPNRRLAALLVGVLAACASPVFAADDRTSDVIDQVIEGIDPGLAPARSMIVCRSAGGTQAACTEEVGSVAISDESKLAVAAQIVAAARDGRWGEVTSLGGRDFASTLACTTIHVPATFRRAACEILQWTNLMRPSTLDKAYQALEASDFWLLVELTGPEVCELVPGHGAIGATKDMTCGSLAAVLAQAKTFGETFAALFARSPDAAEALAFGDDGWMLPNTYYSLYWQPRYHAAVERLLAGEKLDALVTEQHRDCITYFDLRRRTPSNARNICEDLTSHRFYAEVRGFAAALPLSASAYFQSTARPHVRALVRATYGTPPTRDIPGRTVFVESCTREMEQRFPFLDAGDASCSLLARQARRTALAPTTYRELAKRCFAGVANLHPSPTAWARACDEQAATYVKEYALETRRLAATLATLTSNGCTVPTGHRAPLRVTCPSFTTHAECLAALSPEGPAYCRVVAGPHAIDGVAETPSNPPSPSSNLRAQ